MWRTINGRRYFYWKVREGGKVRSILIRDPQEIHLIEKLIRESEWLRKIKRERKKQWLEVYQCAKELYTQVMNSVSLLLIQHGFALTRGQLRKVRGERMRSELERKKANLIEQIQNRKVAIDWYKMGIEAILKSVNLDESDKVLILEQVSVDKEKIKEQLNWNKSSAVERMLIELIAFLDFEVKFYRSLKPSNPFREKLYDNAVRRYMKALEVLSKVRQKNIVFVNITDQQNINIERSDKE